MLFSPFGSHHQVRSLLGWHRPPWSLTLCPGRSLLGSPPLVPTHSPSPCANYLSSCVLFISNESIKKCGVLTRCSRLMFSALYKYVEYLNCHWTLMHRGWRGDTLPHWDPWDPLVPSLPQLLLAPLAVASSCPQWVPSADCGQELCGPAHHPPTTPTLAPLLTHNAQITMGTRG